MRRGGVRTTAPDARAMSTDWDSELLRCITATLPLSAPAHQIDFVTYQLASQVF